MEDVGAQDQGVHPLLLESDLEQLCYISFTQTPHLCNGRVQSDDL